MKFIAEVVGVLSYVGRFLRWFGGAPNYSDQLRDNYCEGGSVIVVVHQLSISVLVRPTCTRVARTA